MNTQNREISIKINKYKRINNKENLFNNNKKKIFNND